MSITAGPSHAGNSEARADRPVLEISERSVSGASALGFSARVIRVLVVTVYMCSRIFRICEQVQPDIL